MVVTISRAYGAAGNPIAHGVAERLGYALLDDAIPPGVATSVGIPEEEVERRAEQAPTLAERVVRGLAGATPELGLPGAPVPGSVDERVRVEIERHIREVAAAGDVVVLGRCANAVVGASAGVLRVFLTGDRAWRAARVASSLGYSLERAQAEIERVDLARRRFARERYDFGWGEPAAYDLLVDASRLGIEASVATIVAAATAVATATGTP